MMYYIRNNKGEYLKKEVHDRLVFQKDVTKGIRFSTRESAEGFCERNKYEHISGRIPLKDWDYEIKGIGVDAH